MNAPTDQFENVLIEQVQPIECAIPKLSDLIRAAEMRKRRRKVWTSLIMSIPVILVSLLSIRWLSDLNLDGNATSTPLPANTSMVPMESDRRKVKLKSNLSNTVSPTNAVSAPLVSNNVIDDGFRVYATWTVPVLVKEEKTDGTMAHVVREIQVRKKIDTTTLNQFEINSIRSVLPASQERPDIL